MLYSYFLGKAKLTQDFQAFWWLKTGIGIFSHILTARSSPKCTKTYKARPACFLVTAAGTSLEGLKNGFATFFVTETIKNHSVIDKQVQFSILTPSKCYSQEPRHNEQNSNNRNKIQTERNRDVTRVLEKKIGKSQKVNQQSQVRYPGLRRPRQFFKFPWYCKPQNFRIPKGDQSVVLFVFSQPNRSGNFFSWDLKSISVNNAPNHQFRLDCSCRNHNGAVKQSKPRNSHAQQNAKKCNPEKITRELQQLEAETFRAQICATKTYLEVEFNLQALTSGLFRGFETKARAYTVEVEKVYLQARRKVMTQIYVAANEKDTHHDPTHQLKV